MTMFLRSKRRAKSFDPDLYGQLLAKTQPGVIVTEAENERLLVITSKLMDKGEQRTPEEDKLYSLLLFLIKEFEERYYQPEIADLRSATPLEVLKELMLANNVKQVDLVPLFGSKSLVSDVMSGRRVISKRAAKRLSEYFRVSTDLFI